MHDFSKIKKQQKAEFSQRLLEWSGRESNLRSFPWREVEDPYATLVAELLLRRTNAKAVTSLYDEFMTRYPNIQSFQKANPVELKSLVSRLGLHWRAENLVSLAEYLRERQISELKLQLSDLQSLPGVGPYVARAVLVNTRNLPVVPVDTNVVRIICRFFGLRHSDGLRRNKAFQNFADELVCKDEPRRFNYGILDLAASICRSDVPDCSLCPLSRSCVYFNSSQEGN